MAIKTIKQMNEDARALLTEAKAIYDKGEDATPEELDAAAVKTADAQKISEDLVKYKTGDALEVANRVENTLAILNRPDRPAVTGGATKAGTDGVGTDRDGRVRTLGQSFTEDDRYRNWLKAVAPEGHIPQGMRIESPSVAVKTLITLAGDLAAARPMLGLPERRPEVVTLGWMPLVVRDLISVIPTESDLIQVVRERTRTNNADVVGEATTTAGSGTKPESALDWEVIEVAVKTIAHWIPATTRVLLQARRLRAEIDTFLRTGIDQREEALVFSGNPATDPNQWVGLLNTPGVLVQAFSTDILATARKAKTKVMVSGRARPTAYVMHPNDWEAYDLRTDAQGRYYFGGPLDMGTPRLWGLRVAESENATAGTAWVADWRDGVLYDREQTTVRASTEHADFFIRNMVAILAEKMCTFHVRRPKSFCSFALA